jgi:hypothetical protein
MSKSSLATISGMSFRFRRSTTTTSHRHGNAGDKVHGRVLNQHPTSIEVGSAAFEYYEELWSAEKDDANDGRRRRHLENASQQVDDRRSECASLGHQLGVLEVYGAFLQ